MWPGNLQDEYKRKPLDDFQSSYEMENEFNMILKMQYLKCGECHFVNISVDFDGLLYAIASLSMFPRGYPSPVSNLQPQTKISRWKQKRQTHRLGVNTKGIRHLNKFSISLCFSKCGPCTSSVSITWKLVRKADYLVLL